MSLANSVTSRVGELQVMPEHLRVEREIKGINTKDIEYEHRVLHRGCREALAALHYCTEAI